MRLRDTFSVAFTLVAAFSVTAPQVSAQSTPPLLTVIPLARAAAFEYRLDLVPGSPWSPDDKGTWADNTHRATLEWRKTGGTTWKQALDFVKVMPRPDLPAAYYPLTDPRLATMLFGLEEGKSYDYRVTVIAPGYPTAPITGSFTTLTGSVPAASGKTILLPPDTPDYYQALKTALGAPGTENPGAMVLFQGNVDGTGKPVPTIIRKQIAANYQAMSSAGIGQMFSWSGKPDAWLTLGVAPGHDVTFDGSDPAFDVKGQGLWEPVPDGTVLKDFNDASVTLPSSAKIYRTRKAVVYDRPVQSMYFETEPGGSAWRLLWFSAIPAKSATGNPAIPDGLRARWIEPSFGDSGGFKLSDGISSFLAAAQSGSPAFCHHTDGRIYVYLNGGRNPETVYMKVPLLNSPLDIQPAVGGADVHNLKVVGLKLQYFRGPWANVDLQYEPKNDQGGISLGNVNGIVLQDCLLKGVGYSICMRSSRLDKRRNIVIKGCTITQRGLAPEYDAAKNAWVGPKWTYVKLSFQEQIAISLVARGISVLDTTIEGHNDAVCCGDGNGYPSADYSGNQTTYCEGMEVDNCTFKGIVDDCYEPTDYNVCIAATNNTMRRSYKGFACPRAQGGPIYFIRNRWLGQGEYVAFADRQAPTKLGHPNVPDTAYKYMANNTFVNCYVPQNGITGEQTLVGFSGSGTSYNLVAKNNYVACDGAAIDWPYGALGYDHIFDYNIYVELRTGSQPSQYSSSWKGMWGSQGVPLMNGDDPWASNGNGYRYYKSFQSWQMGRNDSYGTNMPGYTGSIPSDVVSTTTPGCTYNNVTWPSQKVRWLHDSHGRAYDNQPHDLVGFPSGAGAPINGVDVYETFDFHPRPGGWGVGAGIGIPNITFDCGPAWSTFEESGRPTVGAYPGSAGTVTPHTPPTLTLPEGTTGTPDEHVSLPVTYSASEGAITSVVAGVTGPDGILIDSLISGKTATGASIVFTPTMIGKYNVMVTVMDDRGATTSAQTNVDVKPAQLPGGSITVTVTPSVRTARPGEPVVYTIIVENPTDRVMQGVSLKQQLPVEVTLNLASALLDGKAVNLSVKKNLVTMDLGTMAPGTSHTLIITAVIN